jgi:hypothetical protein
MAVAFIRAVSCLATKAFGCEEKLQPAGGSAQTASVAVRVFT